MSEDQEKKKMDSFLVFFFFVFRLIDFFISFSSNELFFSLLHSLNLKFSFSFLQKVEMNTKKFIYNTKLSTNYIANLIQIQIQSEIQINNKHNKEK